MFAMQCYDNPQCTSMEEFLEDLRRFRYLKRLLRRFYKNGELRERLILNHLIVIFNVFGYEAGVEMLALKIPLEQWPTVKPFLIFLNAIKNDDLTGIEMDKYVIEKLREIRWAS